MARITCHGQGTRRRQGKSEDNAAYSNVMKAFRGKEFLLDSRIWNCDEAQNANVPPAGERFSAMGLAHFYHNLGVSGRILDNKTLDKVSAPVATETVVNALQGGATVMSNHSSSSEEHRKSLGVGYLLIAFGKIASGFGHAGVGGSIGLHHQDPGLLIALLTSKADGGNEVITTISRVIMKLLIYSAQVTANAESILLCMVSLPTCFSILVYVLPS